MPAKFRLELQEPLKSNISGQTAAVRSKRASGEWCTYAQFVSNLAKGMATVAEEAHHYTTGMSGEAGEALDITKKSWIYEKPLDIEHLLEELGDMRWYYQGMLNLLGVTDEDVQAANTVKLMKRYPDGVYSNQAAIDRADKAPSFDTVAPRKFFGQQSIPIPQKAAEDIFPTLTPTQQDQLYRERQRVMQTVLATREREIMDAQPGHDHGQLGVVGRLPSNEQPMDIFTDKTKS